MKNIALLLSYNGKNYHGWQVQPNNITIEEILTNALKCFTKTEIKITGCSRTDSGVHALYYVCNFFCDITVPTEKLPLALNTKLPNDIKVFKATEVANDFHSRFSAKNKTYIYKVSKDMIPNPFKDGLEFNFSFKTNFDDMKKACEYFIGQHDFSSFMSAGGSQKTTIRTIEYLSVAELNNSLIFEITADAYLYNMVRIIVGTLLQVGTGKFKPSDIPTIINKKDRKYAGITAPAEGLYLKTVDYGYNLFE